MRAVTEDRELYARYAALVSLYCESRGIPFLTTWISTDEVEFVFTCTSDKDEIQRYISKLSNALEPA